MSGGHFDYKQFHIGLMADELEQLIINIGREKTEEEMKDEHWRMPDWYERYPEDKFHHKYPDEVIEKFKEGLDTLRKAYIYAQRIDWLLSGDDGEQSFLKRLKQELETLKNL